MASDNHAPHRRLRSWNSSMTITAASSVVRRALALVWLALGTLAVAQTPAPPAPDAAAKVLRAEVANPVNAAQDAARAGQKEQAETKLREAAMRGEIPGLSKASW